MQDDPTPSPYCTACTGYQLIRESSTRWRWSQSKFNAPQRQPISAETSVTSRPISDIREAHHSDSKAMQLPRSSHPLNTTSPDAGTSIDIGLSFDSLENRLLQRSPVRYSERHHPETSKCAEQCSSDRKCYKCKTIPHQAPTAQPALVTS